MNGSIPVLHVEATSLAETWEESLIRLYDFGCEVKTEYDNPDDPPSKDATMIMTVLDPSSEPLIHRCFPGGLEDLEEYRQEVVDGIKDHWVRDPNNSDDKRWEYTYHGRLTKYGVLVAGSDHRGVVGVDKDEIDQLQKIVDKLATTPHSRRCNVVTWQPWQDPGCFDPPCLQSIWCRILPDDEGVWRLNMNVRFRSRDAFMAAFMNMFAFICLQESLTNRIAEKACREVKLGRYCDLSDSYHIYGKDMKRFEKEFLGQIKVRSWEDRTWTREFAQPFFKEAKPKIRAKIREIDGRK